MDYKDLDFKTQLEFTLRIKQRLEKSKKCYPMVVLNGMKYGSINEEEPVIEEDTLEEEYFDLIKMKDAQRKEDIKKKVIYEANQDDIEETDRIEVGDHLVGVTEGKLTYITTDGETALLDTKNHISHEKAGFAAFIMNKNKQLLIFNHKDGDDNIKHSSFSNGEDVIGAGELRIEQGVLTHLTIHSGHYKPTAKDISNVVKKLEEQGVDIDQVKILSFDGKDGAPDEDLPNVSRTIDHRAIQMVIDDTILDIKAAIKKGKTLTIEDKLAILDENYNSLMGTQKTNMASFGFKNQVLAKSLLENEEINSGDLGDVEDWVAMLEQLKVPDGKI